MKAQLRISTLKKSVIFAQIKKVVNITEYQCFRNK